MIFIKTKTPCYQEHRASPSLKRQPVKSCAFYLLHQFPAQTSSILHFLATFSQFVSIFGNGLIATKSTDSCPFSHLKILLCVLISMWVKSELPINLLPGPFLLSSPSPDTHWVSRSLCFQAAGRYPHSELNSSRCGIFLSFRYAFNLNVCKCFMDCLGEVSRISLHLAYSWLCFFFVFLTPPPTLQKILNCINQAVFDSRLSNYTFLGISFVSLPLKNCINHNESL